MATGEMTIDELARRAGTTTRNVRAYQTRGLLWPPRMVARVGYYDHDHLVRLSYIARLQQRGFSLAAISELLEGWTQGRTLSDVLGFEQALRAPWGDEAPERCSRRQLEELFPGLTADAGLLDRALAARLVVARGDDFDVPSPRLLRVGAELVAAGLPLDAVIDQHALLATDLGRIARRMVALFEDHVWEPFAAAGYPAPRLAGVTDALQRMRPAASAAVVAVFARAMDDAVAVSAAEHTSRLMAPGGCTPT